MAWTNLPSLERYLKTTPHSGFDDRIRLEPLQIELLFRLTPPNLAYALFSVSEVMKDLFPVSFCGNSYCQNWGFIVVDRTPESGKEDSTEKGVSKKGLLGLIGQEGFVSIDSDHRRDKRTFVDCLINRNKDLDALYYGVRGSMPLIPSKRRHKSLLNVFCCVGNDKAFALLKQKNMSRIGLLNRFLFVRSDVWPTVCGEKEGIEAIVKVAESIVREKVVKSVAIPNHEVDTIYAYCDHIAEELKDFVYIRGQVSNIVNLYRTVLIKLYAILELFKDATKSGRYGSMMDIADALARLLINAHLMIMNEMSRNKQLYYELFDYMRYAKMLTFRDITRKFQSDDKTVLRYYVDFLCSTGFLTEVKAHSFLKNKREMTFFRFCDHRITPWQ